MILFIYSLNNPNFNLNKIRKRHIETRQLLFMIRTIQNTMKNLLLKFNQKSGYANVYSKDMALNLKSTSKGKFEIIFRFQKKKKYFYGARFMAY